MKKIFSVLMASIACCALNVDTCAADTATGKCPTIEIRFIAGKSQKASYSATSGEEGSVVLGAKPMLKIDDLVDTKVSMTEGQIVLNVGMNPTSAKRVERFTAHG